AIDHDVPQRLDPLLLRFDVREPEAAAVGDVDAHDGGRCGGDLVPQPERLERPAAAAGQRRRAVIEARLRARLPLDGLDDGDVEPEGREGYGKARTDHAATRDHDVAVPGLHRHRPAAISRSMSSGSRGSSRLSTSGSPRVTATSS